MSSGNGIRPPETAEKSLGEIVSEVSDKATLLVREEIELAKAEIHQKMTRMMKGVALGALAGVFLVFMLIYFFHALSWFWVDLFNWSGIWLGYLVTTGVLSVLGAIAGLLAVRFFKKATPPKPELAIEEAKKTRAVLEEARG
jgi:uncharacterized membrane protein YqjE